MDQKNQSIVINDSIPIYLDQIVMFADPGFVPELSYLTLCNSISRSTKFKKQYLQDSSQRK